MNPETTTIGLILLIPIFLSLFLLLLIKVFMRRDLNLEDNPADPPSYFICRQDLHAKDDGKPPAYSTHSPPAYHAIITIEAEEMPLDIVLQTVLEQRQHQRRLEKNTSPLMG